MPPPERCPLRAATPGAAPARCHAQVSSLPPIPRPQATLELPSYAQRLGLLYGGVFLLLGGPIAAQTFEPLEQVTQPACFASTGDEGGAVAGGDGLQ